MRTGNDVNTVMGKRLLRRIAFNPSTRYAGEAGKINT
jgi:hypothetical protein